MLAASDHFGGRHFRASEIPHAERFSAWRSVLNNWLLEANVTATSNAPFGGGAYLRVLPDVRFGWGALDGSVYRRTRSNVVNDNDDLFLMVNLSGRIAASRRGDEIVLAPGDAYLMGCAQTGDCGWGERVELLCIRLKHDAVAPLARNLHDVVGRKIPASDQHLRLLSRYVRLLDETEPLESAEARTLVTRHICDLAALAFGARNDEQALASERSLHDARLRAVKAHVDKRIASPTLSLESIAAALGVSPRSVQRLFEREGTSFSEFLLSRRLARAHSLLSAATNGQTIGDIAFASGFGDISWFNRSFRARYGATPSDIRSRH